MYIRKIEIKNIRSISDFKMEFSEGNEAGWHVLIGDNGAGKSTIIRAIALGLLGPDLANALYGYQDWSAWKAWNNDHSPKVKLTLVRDRLLDKPDNNNLLTFTSTVEILRSESGDSKPGGSGLNQGTALYGKYAGSGWFSSSYGPFRRLTGGNEEFNFIVAKRPRLAAHLSAFREDFSLNHVIRTLKDFEIDSRTSKMAADLLQKLITFINSSELLPHGAEIEGVDSKGLNIKDANGALISLYEMSDGYRSILALTLDILLRMCEIFSPQIVFQSDEKKIHIPGIVIIDEIDVHLHPTWQIQIGKWFTSFFPKVQFIVTTHSPFVCRAARNGSVWYLAAPGSDKISGQVMDDDLKKLLYGSVLDAYGTDIFGDEIERDADDQKNLERYSYLSQKEVYDPQSLTGEEKKELETFKNIYKSDAPFAV